LAYPARISRRGERKKEEEKKSHRHQTIMNCTTCITTTQALHIPNNIAVKSFLP